MAKILGERPSRYTKERIDSEKVSKSYIVWMLTRDPVVRKETREKDASEVTKWKKFTSRTVGKL